MSIRQLNANISEGYLGIIFGEHTQKVTNITKIPYGNFLNSLYWNIHREIAYHMIIPQLFKEGLPICAMRLSNYSENMRQVNEVAIICYILQSKFNKSLQIAYNVAEIIHKSYWPFIWKDLRKMEAHKQGIVYKKSTKPFIHVGATAKDTWDWVDSAFMIRETFRELVARGFEPYHWTLRGKNIGYYYIGWAGAGGFSDIMYPQLFPTWDEANEKANKVATKEYYIIHKLY